MAWYACLYESLFNSAYFLLSDNLSIIATNNSYTITIKIEDINTRSAGEVIEFDKVNLGMVNASNLVYSNTTFDPSKGNITITSLDLIAREVSGTFFFEAKEVVPPYLDIIQVSAGIFSNISF